MRFLTDKTLQKIQKYSGRAMKSWNAGFPTALLRQSPNPPEYSKKNTPRSLKKDDFLAQPA